MAQTTIKLRKVSDSPASNVAFTVTVQMLVINPTTGVTVQTINIQSGAATFSFPTPAPAGGFRCTFTRQDDGRSFVREGFCNPPASDVICLAVPADW